MATENRPDGASDSAVFGVDARRMRRARWLAVLGGTLAGAFHVFLYATGAGPAFLIVGIALLLASGAVVLAAARVVTDDVRARSAATDGGTLGLLARSLVPGLPLVEAAIIDTPVRATAVLVLTSLLADDDGDDRGRANR